MRKLILSVALLSLVGCHSPSVDRFAWLAGTWTGEADGVRTMEQWSEPAGKRWMVGMNSSMRMDDVEISSEFLRIQADHGGVTYEALPEAHEQPVLFRLVESGDRSATFENPDHDFPQRIIYRREGETLHVRIEGVVGGETRSREWVWTREVD